MKGAEDFLEQFKNVKFNEQNWTTFVVQILYLIINFRKWTFLCISTYFHYWQNGPD
jgi:hypothetical protein